MANGKSQDILESVGHELKTSPPKILSSTSQKFGPARAKKQKIAILLSKARRQGASIPQSGGRSLKGGS